MHPLDPRVLTTRLFISPHPQSDTHPDSLRACRTRREVARCPPSSEKTQASSRSFVHAHATKKEVCVPQYPLPFGLAKCQAVACQAQSRVAANIEFIDYAQCRE